MGVVSGAEYDIYDDDSIQNAINNASMGDIIYINDGNYTQNIIINKSISLIGNNATIHGSSPSDNVITVTVDNVNISGLNITGMYSAGKSAIQLYNSNNSNISDNYISIGYNNYYNIRLINSDNITIINNNISLGNYGIYTEYSNDAIIQDNTILGNRYNGVSLRYNSSDAIVVDNIVSWNDARGIYLYRYSNNIVIGNNTINHNGNTDGTGIYMSYLCNNTTIIDNIIQYNTNKAIHVRDGCTYTRIINNNVSYNDGNGNGNPIYVYCTTTAMCNNTIIEDNIVKANHDIYNAAIHIYKANNNSVINNTVSMHNGPHSAIELCISDDSIVSGNNVSFNTNMIYGGITIYSGENNVITENMVVNNTNYNINLLYGGDNLIYNNYIGGNVSISGIGMVYTWNVTNTTGPNIVGGPFIGGNYYTDYTGNDSDGDGFGGFPYFIPNPSGLNNHDWLPLVIPAEETLLCGDVDCDADIDIIDVIEIYKRVCNPEYLLGCSNAGDTDCDADIDIIDVIEVYKKVCDPLYGLNCC